MFVRKYLPEDFEIVGKWFDAREHFPEGGMHKLLPPDGFLCEDDNGPLACVWVYLIVGAPLTLIEWSVTRPESGIKALTAMRMCIEEAKKFIFEQGKTIIFQFLGDKRLIKYYEKHCGFQAAEQATLMVCGRA